jgi:hypothetical protein
VPLALRVGVALAVLAAAQPLAAQCAMCRRALESPEAHALASALRAGIALLFVAPLVTFAAVALAAWRLARSRSESAGRVGAAASRERRALSPRAPWGECRVSGTLGGRRANPAESPLVPSLRTPPAEFAREP